MGPKSQEITSCAFNSTYPSYYKEFQIRNWSPIDVVVTELNGSQYIVPASPNISGENACIEVEFRSCTGMRASMTEFGMKDEPIKGKKLQIPFDLVRNNPYRVVEYNIILSTVDHSIVAKEMLHELTLSPVVYETRVDDDLVDPRLVFQVIDPCNQWSELFVNVFGQTIIVRAGHWSSALPFPESPEEQQTFEKPRLICYLRYPNDYYQDARSVTTVFDISLENVLQGEPISIPGGDVICVAPTMETLAMVLAKKSSGYKGTSTATSQISDKMVPKELYESAQAQFKEEVKRLERENKQKMESLSTSKDTEISKLKFELEQVKHEKTVLKNQVEHWEAINRYQTSIASDQVSLEKARAEARKEAYEASRKDIDNMWNILKIAGTLCAGVLSFGITVMAKSSGKKK